MILQDLNFLREVDTMCPPIKHQGEQRVALTYGCHLDDSNGAERVRSRVWLAFRGRALRPPRRDAVRIAQSRPRRDWVCREFRKLPSPGGTTEWTGSDGVRLGRFSRPQCHEEAVLRYALKGRHSADSAER